MLIRCLTEEDMPQLSELYRHFWGEASDVEKMKRQFVFLQKKGTHILLGAEENSRLMGSVMGVVCEELYGDCRPFLVLENMIVSPECRQKEWGAACCCVWNRWPGSGLVHRLFWLQKKIGWMLARFMRLAVFSRRIPVIRRNCRVEKQKLLRYKFPGLRIAKKAPYG